VDLGYARVSTAKQDLDRQLDALHQAGIAPERVYLDKKSGATTDRPGLNAALAYARDGDVIVVHTLDRLGRTVRDTLNLIHELVGRGVGVRNLADPIRVDSANHSDPMAHLAVVLLALFGQMERTYTLERAAHARAVATANGRRVVGQQQWHPEVGPDRAGHHGRQVVQPRVCSGVGGDQHVTGQHGDRAQAVLELADVLGVGGAGAAHRRRDLPIRQQRQLRAVGGDDASGSRRTSPGSTAEPAAPAMTSRTRASRVGSRITPMCGRPDARRTSAVRGSGVTRRR